MRISDCEWLHATKHQTWEALTDPEVLQKCIPTCFDVTRQSPTEFHLKLQPKVDGTSVPYEGEIMFADIDENYSCTLAFEGKGAATGMIIGTAQISLSDRENGTRLTYAIAAGQSIWEYAPASRAASDYTTLLETIQPTVHPRSH